MEIPVVVFSINHNRYALHLDKTEKVIPSLEVMHLPNSPDIILGVVNIEGNIIPVVNTRKKFSLPEKEIELGDKLIIAKTTKRLVALPADDVEGVGFYHEEQIINPKKILPNIPAVDGVIGLEDGIIIIHDIDLFLSLEEEEQLLSALC